MDLSRLELKDLPAIVQLQPEDWSDILPYFQLYIRSGFCYPVKATEGGILLGVGNSILNGNSGWISHIIVSKDYRNQGIGKDITKNAIDTQLKKGCKTILLIATEIGEPLYYRLGFRDVCCYTFLNGKRLSFESSNRPMKLEESHFNELNLFLDIYM